MSNAHGCSRTRSSRRAGFDPSYAASFWDITNRQDFSACGSVTRGLHSRGYRPGPFDEREDGVRAFQEQLARLYRSDRWEQPRGAEMGKSALTAPGDQPGSPASQTPQPRTLSATDGGSPSGGPPHAA
jgi:Ring hydroxylating alpha subunit (catalytic domain)